MGTEKVKFHVERSSFGVHSMVVLMLLSVAFRIIGCWGMWSDHGYAISQIALPIVSALLIIACIWLLGKRALWLSFIPVVLGAVFFIIKALSFESKVHMILCILLYIAVITLYFCTVFGIIHTKWLLVALFGLPFLYHVFVEDLPALRNTVNPVSFAEGMQEMGVLCIMLGLFCLSLSMKKTAFAVSPASHEKAAGLFWKRKNEETEDPEHAEPDTGPLPQESAQTAGVTQPPVSATQPDCPETALHAETEDSPESRQTGNS